VLLSSSRMCWTFLKSAEEQHKNIREYHVFSGTCIFSKSVKEQYKNNSIRILGDIMFFF
jgi:hypothetical protein